MNAVEIAETLINGNISHAREAILNTHDGFPRTPTEATRMFTDVVIELTPTFGVDDAFARVRRCVTGPS